jgi:hypothetical protein
MNITSFRRGFSSIFKCLCNELYRTIDFLHSVQVKCYGTQQCEFLVELLNIFASDMKE